VLATQRFRSSLRAATVAVFVLVTGGAGMSAASAAGPTQTVTRAVSGSVPAGQQIRLAASIHSSGHAVRGLRLELFRIAPSGRRLVSTVRTDKLGAATVMVAPSATTRYYWKFAGGSGYAASGTRIVVKVTQAIVVVVPLSTRIMNEAERHLGAPYVYGATGPNAFDCSGLTQYVFGRLGITLPRTAADQYGSVRHVSNADRQIGDLIFFRLGGGGVDHVGIYAGNDQILVAPQTGDHVRYEKIWTSYSVGRVG
jgi:cell wall-associated NlpC family hydrolase